MPVPLDILILLKWYQTWRWMRVVKNVFTEASILIIWNWVTGALKGSSILTDVGEHGKNMIILGRSRHVTKRYRCCRPKCTRRCGAVLLWVFKLRITFINKQTTTDGYETNYTVLKTYQVSYLFFLFFQSNDICFWFKLSFSFKYDLLVDRNAHLRRAAPDWEEKIFYGQLKHILVLKLPPAPELDLEDDSLCAETTYLLACIHMCDVDKRNSLGMPIYSKMGATEVVDLDRLECLVGRVRNGGYTAIIDRTGEWQDATYARADWCPTII